MKPIDLAHGDRVLVTRLDYLGDVVLSLPLVDAIRLRHPGVEIDYMARRPGADLVTGDPRFSLVHTVDRNAGPSGMLKLVSRLRARKYRAVIDLYSNPRSAWLSWWSGAPVRIGGDRRGRRHLYTHAVRVDRGVRAATRHHLAFGAPLGVTTEYPAMPTLAISEDELHHAETVLAGVGAEPVGLRIGIHPGGKWPVKRWPAGSFADLARFASRRFNARIVVFTGPGEEKHTQALARLLGDDATYLGAMPIRRVAATLAALDGFVACDGGVMHTSVAVGTPTVGVFGSSEPDVWFPYEHHGPFRAAWVPLECRPCHRHVCPLGHTNCLNTLAPELVLAKLEEIMARREVER